MPDIAFKGFFWQNPQTSDIIIAFVTALLQKNFFGPISLDILALL
jgi:hypothetical protein